MGPWLVGVYTSLSQWTLKKKFELYPTTNAASIHTSCTRSVGRFKKFELYFPYLIWNPQKFKRLAIG